MIVGKHGKWRKKHTLSPVVILQLAIRMRGGMKACVVNGAFQIFHSLASEKVYESLLHIWESGEEHSLLALWHF
jgi:hypothetical protein